MDRLALGSDQNWQKTRESLDTNTSGPMVLPSGFSGYRTIHEQWDFAEQARRRLENLIPGQKE